jgi:hypothetical protein
MPRIASIPQRNREACVDKFEAMQMFVRVVEKKSFSAVAKERGIGQPAVSKQISALEDELGAELIQRTSRSLALTEPGRAATFTNPPCAFSTTSRTRRHESAAARRRRKASSA